MARKRISKDTPIETPFTVVIDSREQLPYSFEGLRADAKQKRRPVRVQRVTRGLQTGDYSIDGHEGDIAIERKSKADLFHTLGQDRERFERELDRLAMIHFGCVVVEAEWSEILTEPPTGSRLLPKTIVRSVLAWQQRYPNVHWTFWPGRAVCEAATFQILSRFWRERHEKKPKKEGETHD